jgi:hypothetical protein
MKRLFAAVLLVLSFAAHADTMVARNSHGESMFLFDTPCANGKILKAVADQFEAAKMPVPTDLKAGRAELAAAGVYSVCWLLSPSLSVVVVYEDGMAAAIPLMDFRAAE